MAIGPANFWYHSTTTPGKLATIEWQKNLIKSTYNEAKLSGYGVSIPGNGSQLARHRDELLSYGIAEDKQIMVDWNVNIAYDLKHVAKEIEFKGQILHANLVEVLEQLWRNNQQIDIIDFDDIGYLNSNHCRLISQAFEKNIKAFIVVYTTRGCSRLPWFLDKWRSNLQIPQKIWMQKRNAYRTPWSYIQEQTIKHFAKNKYSTVAFRPYQGRGHCPMQSCVLIP